MTDKNGSLKAGDSVYRVEEYDYSEGRPHTWKVESRLIGRIGPSQILLVSSFRMPARVRWSIVALGNSFFATPEAAIARFIEDKHREHVSLERRCADVERALHWAHDQRNTSAKREE